MAGVACFVAVKAAETVVRLAEDPAARLVAGAQAPQNVPCRPLLCYSSRHFQKLVASYVRTCVALFCQGKITGHLVSAQLSGVTPASPTRHLALSNFLFSFSFFFVFRSSCYCLYLFRLCASYFGTLNALSIFLVLGIGELVFVLKCAVASRTAALFLAAPTFYNCFGADCSSYWKP